MKHLDLFSGIGGFALAAQWVWGSEYENVGFCDNDPFCQKVLKKHWPEAKIYGDIRKLKPRKGAADIVTGGFPCQPFSQAGKREGTEDNRYLWPEMLRVIRTVKPSWVIAENVYGIITLRGGWYSKKCALVWRPLATPSGRLLFRLVPLTHRTKGTGSGLLPTPRASDGARWTKNKKTDVQKSISKVLIRFGDISLAYYFLWNQIGLTQAAESYEMMMGYPKGWTELKVSETPSSPKSQQR